MLETERVLTELALTWSWKRIKSDFSLIETSSVQLGPEITDEDIPF
jgi:hypothetical protein